jgi:acyl dehydratase
VSKTSSPAIAAATSCRPSSRWSFKAPVRPGDEITAEVEVLETRTDKPLTKLRTTIANQDGTVVLDGTALVWIRTKRKANSPER